MVLPYKQKLHYSIFKISVSESRDFNDSWFPNALIYVEKC